jgi:hypothetical protein
MRDAVKRGSAGPVNASAPAGRAERLGLARPGAAGTARSQAEELLSRIVHAGHRHKIVSELTGNWQDRPAVVFDLDLATDYGDRGEDTGGVVTGRFHVGAIVVRVSRGRWAVTRTDIREHLPQAGRGARLPRHRAAGTCLGADRSRCCAPCYAGGDGLSEPSGGGSAVTRSARWRSQARRRREPGGSGGPS